MAFLSSSDIDLTALLADLQRWVEIETPSWEAARVNVLVDLVARQAEAGGLHVERIEGRDGCGDTLIVRSQGPQQSRGPVVLSHLDTVHPVGTLADASWRQEGDCLFGPGIYDMKSGALMALTALRLIKERLGSSAPLVTIVFGPDEEIGSGTSREMIERECNGAVAALVTEPARDGGKVVTARKGVAMFDILVKGRASHAGVRPLDGRSAIREAARLVLALEAMNDVEQGVTVTVGTIHGGTARNVIPAECRLIVDVRVPGPEFIEPVIGRISKLTSSDPDISVRIDGGLNRPPYASTPNGEILFQHARTIAAALDIDLVGIKTGGGSDGNFAAALGVPTLDGLGADGEAAHTTHEHVYVSSLAPRTALLANLMATAGEVEFGQ